MNSESIFIISGPGGFVGKHLLNHLLFDTPHQVITIDRELKCKFYRIPVNIQHEPELADVSDYIAGRPVKFVHCATLFAKVNNEQHIDSLTNANVAYPLRLLECFQVASDLVFINLNSYWQAMEGHIGRTISSYAQSKIDFLSKLQNKDFYPRISHTDLYLYDTYGSFDDRQKLMPYLLQSFDRGEPLKLNNCGQLINLLDIRDVIEGIMCTSYLASSRAIFELSSKFSYTIEEVVQQFSLASGTSVDIAWGKDSPLIYMREKWKIAANPPGWQQQISLEDGFSRLWRQRSAKTKNI